MLWPCLEPSPLLEMAPGGHKPVGAEPPDSRSCIPFDFPILELTEGRKKYELTGIKKKRFSK